MTVVDCHCHIWETPAPDRPYPWTPDPHLLSDLLAVFDEHGVTRGVQVTPLMAGFDNGYGVRSARRANGRLAVFGRFDGFAANAGTRLAEWMRQPGAAGVRMTFFGEDQRLLEDRPAALDPFWAAAAEQDVPVAVFAPLAMERLLEALERHAGLQMIVDHLGLGVYEGCPDPRAGFPLLERFAEHPQVRLKVSGAVEISREPYPFRDMHDLVVQAHAWFGPGRLMWGSNFPVVKRWATYRESLEYLREVEGLEADELASIYGGTVTDALAPRPATD